MWRNLSVLVASLMLATALPSAAAEPETEAPSPVAEATAASGSETANESEKPSASPSEGDDGLATSPTAEASDGAEAHPDEPTTEDPCYAELKAHAADLEALGAKVRARMQAFHEEFAEARALFASQNHSYEEWHEFNEKWRAEGQAVLEALKVQAIGELKAMLGECFDVLASRAMPLGSAWLGFHAERAYTGLPPKPTEMSRHDRAELIRQLCIRELKERAWTKVSSGDATIPESEAERRAWLAAQIKETTGACEDRVREAFKEERQSRQDHFDGEFGSVDLYFNESTGMIVAEGRFIALDGNPESQVMQNFTCEGVATIDRLFLNGMLAEFEPEATKEGASLRLSDTQGAHVLGIHDNPRCIINFRPSAEITSMTLDLSDDLVIERNGAGDLRFRGDGVEGAVLLHGGDANLTEGNVLLVAGKATFLVKNEDRTTERLGEKYHEAVEKKKIGAELKIGKKEKSLDVDEVPIGDLETEVTGTDNKVVITIDSAGGDGKTVSFEFARELFSFDDLTVEVKGVDEDGTVTTLAAREADSLADVLEPGDDGADGIEYWIVEDKNGFQVLVSFAHFSEKRVTVQSVDGPDIRSGAPGFGMAIVLAAAIAASLVVRARRE